MEVANMTGLLVIQGRAGAAQRAQMQARFFAAGGTRASVAASKVTRVHQHAGWAWPVRRCVSIAQALGPPHRGQRAGSTAWGLGVSSFMRAR
jgi:hypothetical protein